jgi:hypothetical protein
MANLLRDLRAMLRKHELRDDIKRCALRVFAALSEPMQLVRAPESVIDEITKTAAHPKETAELFRTWIEVWRGRASLCREHSDLATAAIIDADGSMSSKVWPFAFTHEPGAQSAVLRAIRDGLMDKGQLASFVTAGIEALRTCGDNDLVFRPREDGERPISRGSFKAASPFELLYQFERGGDDILRFNTFGSIRRLVDLVIQLSPRDASRVIAASDHPALFALSVQVAGDALRAQQPTSFVDWITSDQPASVIAAGTYETLQAVSFLDDRAEDARRAHVQGRSGQPSLTLESGDLLERMTAKLGELHDTQFGQHAGYLFSLAEYVLHRRRDGHSDRLTTLHSALEKATTAVLLRTKSADSVLAPLMAGLLLPPRETTTRHLSAIAALLETAGRRDLATALRKLLIDDYARQIDEHRGQHFYVGCDPEGVAWTNAVGEGLAMLDRDGVMDVRTWFLRFWESFALDVWDYEEDHERFCHDVRLVLHIFAACAVAAMHLRLSGPRERASALNATLVDAFLPFQQLIHGLGVYLTDSHERYAAPTVVSMMLQFDEHTERLRGFLSTSAASDDCLDAALRDGRDELKAVARAGLESRFDALRKVSAADVRWWIRRWRELGDVGRGLTAALSFDGDLRTERDVGWDVLELALRAAETDQASASAGHVVATIRRAADALWGLWCPASEETRRDEARRRIASLGILCA